MNYRVTVGFLAALAIMAGLVYGLDRFNVGPTAGAQATATSVAGESLQVFKFDDTKVTAADLRQGENTSRVEKSGDGWVVAGTGEPANRSTIASLIIRMGQLRSTRRVDNPSPDLKEYGLAPALLAIAVQLDDGSRYELEVGDKTPTQSGRYARKVDTGELFVIAEQFGADLERLVADPKEPPTPTPRPAVPIPATTPEPVGTPRPGP